MEYWISLRRHLRSCDTLSDSQKPAAAPGHPRSLHGQLQDPPWPAPYPSWTPFHPAPQEILAAEGSRMGRGAHQV